MVSGSLGAHELAWKKRHDMYKIMKDTAQHVVTHGTDFQGPGEGVIPTSWRLGSHSEHWAALGPCLMGHLLTSSPYYIFSMSCVQFLSLLLTRRNDLAIYLINGW